MKKVSKKMVVFATLLFASVGFAQNQTVTKNSREELKFGVKAGINIANVYDEENQELVAESKIGFAAGGFLSIPFGQYLGFQPEVMYSQKGFKANGTILGVDYDYKRTSSFIDIPLQLQIKPIDEVTVLVGPQFSYLLKIKDELNGSSTTQDQEDVNLDNYKRNIFGFVVGADLNLEDFVISARGGWDISKSDKDGNSTDPRYKNQVLQFTLGYRF